MTGRGAGRCAGTNAPGYTAGRGFGFRRGRGGGNFGCGAGFNRGGGFGRGGGGWGGGGVFPNPVQITPEQEVANLKAQATQLQNTLQDINDRLEELKK